MHIIITTTKYIPTTHVHSIVIIAVHNVGIVHVVLYYSQPPSLGYVRNLSVVACEWAWVRDEYEFATDRPPVLYTWYII